MGESIMPSLRAFLRNTVQRRMLMRRMGHYRTIHSLICDACLFFFL